MTIGRSAERVASVADLAHPQSVIAAIELLLVPYQYDPDRDPEEQERVATASGRYPDATRLYDQDRWLVLRTVYGMGRER
jgi:hypothetical protein